MKKIAVIVLSIILVLGLNVGCTKNKKPSEQKPPKETTAPIEQTNTQIPDTEDKEPENTQGQVNANIKEGTGTFIGVVDSSFVEIKLDNTQSPAEFNILEVKESINGLNENNKVKLTYIIDENGQKVIKSIGKIK